MTDLLERVRATGLLGGPVVVLLSGGRDSVCLLDCAVRLADGVRALHVNYGLRPEAGADEALCRDLCERLGVELEVVRATYERGNVQAWAREVRYAAAARHGIDVAAGHTASDQVETVLYRLAASPGRRALLGMRDAVGLRWQPSQSHRAGLRWQPSQSRGAAGGARLVRPLLSVTREETAAHCRARGLAWAEDASNDSRAYTRGRVRLDLLPALRSLHPAAEANVLRTLEVLRDEAEVLDALLDEVRTDQVAALRALAPALRRLLLGPRADEILALEAGSLDLGDGERAVVEHGRVTISSTRARAPEPPASAVLGLPGRVAFGAGEVVADVGAFAIADGTLDAQALGPRLEVRAWRAGDRMRPLGLGGTKSLQDLFTDRKVARESRRQVPVVVSDGEIAWVPGVATGERFRVTAATRERARLRWHP